MNTTHDTEHQERNDEAGNPDAEQEIEEAQDQLEELIAEVEDVWDKLYEAKESLAGGSR